LKNKVFDNGRIHASKNANDVYETGYVALTVSPYDKEFFDELEPGVRPHIKALLDKGYLPISSCEGHYYDKQNMNWYVMLALGGNDIDIRMHNIVHRIQHIPGLYFETRKKVNNTNQSLRKVLELEDKKAEVEYMNKLFLKNYNHYEYLYIGLFKNSSLLTRLLFSRFSKKLLLNKIIMEFPDERFH